MEKTDEKRNVIDARALPPQERHYIIFDKLLALKPGEVLEVIADHEPVHLLRHMEIENIPVDSDNYYSHPNTDGTYSGFFMRKESGYHDDDIKITNFEQEKAFSEDHFKGVDIYVHMDYKVVLTYIKAGQFIPVHTPNSDLIFSVFKGTGIGIFGEKEVTLYPGSVVIVPRGKSRGIKATTDMEGIHIVSPIPGEADHSEVIRKLKSGEFR